MSLPSSLSLCPYAVPTPGICVTGPLNAVPFKRKSSYFWVSGLLGLRASTVLWAGVPGKTAFGQLYKVLSND